MDTLRVRAYNVRFGDALFITVPDNDPVTGQQTTRHILIDFGNVLTKEGGDDSVFKPVFDDIVAELNGAPLDLYIMTHEHMDHVQGLPHIAEKVYPNGDFAHKLSVDHAWLTASAADDYYDRHPDAEKAFVEANKCFDDILRFISAAPPVLAAEFRSILLNNNPRSTRSCVDFLRKLAPETHTHYVHRGVDLEGRHPFREAQFSVWAPEEDTSEYYGSFRPMALGAAAAPAGQPTGNASQIAEPPAGVDASDFYNVVNKRRSGFVDNILAIDKARNNTSIVFSMEWRGWRLLFTGDAETRSWKTMRREHDRMLAAGGDALLVPVHFLKVSHHGSHNGTPDDEILDLILPSATGDGRPRRALISSYEDTYSGIPHGPTNQRLIERCTLTSTVDSPAELFVDMSFAG